MKSASNDRDITIAMPRCTAQICGVYARVAMLAGFGTIMIALCGPSGVPLGVARRPMSGGTTDWCMLEASSTGKTYDHVSFLAVPLGALRAE
jgi:hypothetical protein